MRRSLRDREPEEIREVPELAKARGELAADSQSLRWLLHPARHTRLILFTSRRAPPRSTGWRRSAASISTRSGARAAV